MTEGKRQIELAGEPIEYVVRRGARRTLGISVNPDGSVVVTAPQGLDDAKIRAVLLKRGAWILRTRRDFEALRPRTPPRRYLSGETHRYLGRQVRLKIDPERPRGVELTRTHLIVGGFAVSENDRVRNRVLRWYQQRAREVMVTRYDACCRALGLSGTTPRLVVRPMSKRWGSLTASGGSLIVNTRLVEASTDLIDYVIVHELCHLKHADHSPAFFDELGARMPNWQDRKRKLEQFML